MSHGEEVIDANAKLIQIAQTLDVPYLVSEQYPTGIGHTVEKISEHVDRSNVIEKMTFSCCEEPNFVECLEKTGRKQVVVTGMETHVCVLQTVLDLLESNYQVFVIEDCVASRTIKNKMLGLDRMRHLGAQIVSSEMVMFEWLERAGTPKFKTVLPYIK